MLLLKEQDGGRKADAAPITVANRAGLHGITLRGSRVYLVTAKEAFVADIKKNGTFGPLTIIIGDLPDAGQHPNA